MDITRIASIGATQFWHAARLLACLIAVQLSIAGARAGEVCQFAGTSDYAGRLTVTTSADTTDGKTTVDVVGRFDGTPMPFVHIRYLAEEISIWASGRMQSVAVNSRYILNGYVLRQGWDVFENHGAGLDAYRIEGKSSDAFRHDYPDFLVHWDPATFGQSWLQDYWQAHPERRRDLDLPTASVAPDLNAPLALVFYWSRWIPRDGEAAPVFLPGFKKDKRIDVTIAGGRLGNDDRRTLETSLHYPWLGTIQASTAKEWISMDGHLSQLAFSVRSQNHSGSGVIRQQECHATTPGPGAQGR